MELRYVPRDAVVLKEISDFMPTLTVLLPLGNLRSFVIRFWTQSFSEKRYWRNKSPPNFLFISGKLVLKIRDSFIDVKRELTHIQSFSERNFHLDISLLFLERQNRRNKSPPDFLFFTRTTLSEIQIHDTDRKCKERFYFYIYILRDLSLRILFAVFGKIEQAKQIAARFSILARITLSEI